MLSGLRFMEIRLFPLAFGAKSRERTTPAVVISDLVENAPKLDSVAIYIPGRHIVGDGSSSEIGESFGNIVRELTDRRGQMIRTLYCKHAYAPAEQGHKVYESDLESPSYMCWNMSTNAYDILEVNEPIFTQNMIGAFCVRRGEDDEDTDSADGSATDLDPLMCGYGRESRPPDPRS